MHQSIQGPTADPCTQGDGSAWDGLRRRGGTGKPGHAPARPGAAPRDRAHSELVRHHIGGEEEEEEEEEERRRKRRRRRRRRTFVWD